MEFNEDPTREAAHEGREMDVDEDSISDPVKEHKNEIAEAKRWVSPFCVELDFLPGTMATKIREALALKDIGKLVCLRERFEVAYGTESVQAVLDGCIDSTEPGKFDKLLAICDEVWPSSLSRSGDDVTSIGHDAFRSTELANIHGEAPSAHLLRLLVGLESNYSREPTTFHSPYVTYLGSSGTGKSFTVTSLANNNVFVIYASLASRSSSAVPPRTPLADRLDACRGPDGVTTLWVRYVRLGLLMVEVAEGLGMRPALFVELQHEKKHVKTQRDLMRLLDKDDLWVDEEQQKLAQAVHRILLHPLQKARMEGGGSRQGHRLIVFAIDEARGLLAPIGGNNCSSDAPVLFRRFRSALRDLYAGNRAGLSHTFFAVLMDTTSKITNFSPPATLDPSAKKQIGKNLFPPIYDIVAVDAAVHRDATLTGWWGETMAKEFGDAQNTILLLPTDQLQRMRRQRRAYGRPLWYAFQKIGEGMLKNARQRPVGGAPGAAPSDESAAQQGNSEAFNLAIEKVEPPRENGPEKERDAALLALWSFIVGFESIETQLGQQLMASRMHYPLFVSDSRQFVRTVEPREPILAEAAMFFLEDWGTRTEAVKAFFKTYMQGLVNPGNMAEMVAGILLLFAAALPRAEREAGQMLVSLPAFLEKLSGCVPGWAVDMSEYDVHLVQLVRCWSSGSLTADEFKLGFFLGQGWFAFRNAPGVNILLPIRNRETGQMSALFVQVKNRAHADHVQQSDLLEASNSFRDGMKIVKFLAGAAVPVVGLYLQLRPFNQDETPDGGGPVAWCEPTQAQPRPRRSRRSAASTLGPTIFYAARVGFNSRLYPVLRRPDQVNKGGWIDRGEQDLTWLFATLLQHGTMGLVGANESWTDTLLANRRPPRAPVSD